MSVEMNTGGIELMKEKCIIFGAGGHGNIAYTLLQEEYDIIGFSDNDKTKWGELFLGKSVIEPKLLPKEDVLIVIASQWYAAIHKQLREIGLKNIKVFWYKTNKNTVLDKSAYILCELSDDELFEKCELDWNKIERIKADFSENYEKKGELERIPLKKDNGLKKILFCAHAFPPVGGAGVQRSLKFVKYLRNFGYDPIVLTTSPDDCCATAMDETLMKEIDDDISIVRINNGTYLPETMSKEEQQEIINLYAGIVNSKDWINEYIKSAGEMVSPLLPDASICWVNKCLKNIESRIDLNEIDAIYTTGGLFGTYVLGYYIKNKYSIPWVQDYRDPWCTNNHYLENIWNHSMKQTLCWQEKIEENLVKKSDAIVVMAENMIDEFVLKYGVDRSKFVEINNGYDEADFRDVPVCLERNEKFTLCYNGHINIGRSPIPLICTISKMIDSGKLNKSKVQWIFNGVVENTWKQQMDQKDKYGIIKYNGYLNHRESIEKAMNSDVLTLFGEAGEGAKVVYTGKVFEYLRMKKPIFCFSSKNGVLDKLIGETQTGKNFEYDDYDGIEDYLMQLYKNWERGEDSIQVNEKEIQKYSRENETKMLAKVFNSLI